MKDKKVKKVKNKKKKIIMLFGLSFVLGILIFISGIIGYFYLANVINPALKNIYKELPLPVVKIENQDDIISRQLFQDTIAVRKFYESKDYTQKGGRVDFSTREGRVRLQIKEKDVLNKLIEDSIIKKIAESKGIKISSQDVDEAVEESLKKSDSNYKKLAVNLNSNYGWTIEQFKAKIVKNQLYLDELFKWYRENLQKSDDYKRAKKIKSDISESGDNFDEIARNFSDGESAKQNGKIPWMDESIIIPELVAVVTSLKEGQISDIVVSPLGMHIVMLEKRREVKSAEGVVKKEVQLKQVFIRSKSFVDWIQEQKKQVKVDVLLKEYEWDKNIGEIDFSSAELKSTVKKIKEKSQGDPSLE